jgi:putative NIF3 family GTP cyclohydrolase 1 type 2
VTAYAFVGFPGISIARTTNIETIQDVIDFLISQVQGAPFDKTVDTVKSGDPSQKVKGIVTTFMANREVIQKSIEVGANLIITHEPTYYSHEDSTDWLENNTVYEEKRKLLEDHNIVVWRFHDYMHSIQPDPVLQAIVEKLQWQKYQDNEHAHIFKIPSESLAHLAQEVKGKLQSKNIRTVGKGALECSKVGILPGAPGGTSQINLMEEQNLDVLITGEISEWMVSEYVRDTGLKGEGKGLIVAGHAPTEEPGMQWLAQWLPQQPQFNKISIKHIPGDHTFGYY